MKLTNANIAQLKRLLMAAKKTYYNSGKNLKVHAEQLDPANANLLANGHLVRGKVSYPEADARVPNRYIEISDAVYDLIEQAVREYQPKAKELSVVRAEPSGKQVEVELPYLMPSLDKKFSGDGSLIKWLAKNPGPYIIMDKLDGVSMELLWEDGAFDKLYKGGSATHGMDWSHAIPHLKLPKKVPAGDGGIRAELIMSKAEFLKKWADKYKNARNLTSGIVNKTRGMHEAVGSITPIVFDVLHKRMAPSTALAYAAKQGFTVVHHIKATKVTEEKLLSYLRTRERADHMIDGLVIAVDKPFALTENNPKSMIAFKAPSEGNSAETKITAIEWRVSRHGQVIPRFTVEPVKLAGVTVTHAAAHNARYVIDNSINIGSIVNLTRSGEVIPYVTAVVKPSRTASMPDESLGPVQWDANKTHLVLVDAKSSSLGTIKALAHFFTEGLGVDGMGQGVAAQLHEAGYNTVGKILRLKESDYMKLPGWQSRKSATMYANIQAAAKDANLVKVMAASGIFGKLIGERKLAALYKVKPGLFDIERKLSADQVAAACRGVAGFKDKSAQPIIDNLQRAKDWLAKLPITFKKAAAVKVSGAKCSGMNVCFTGIRSAELEIEIAQQGGAIASGVNAKTTHLICKDPGSGSAKNEKAHSLGIPVLTIQQFKTKYKL